MEAQRERLNSRIEAKKAEIKELEEQRKGLDKAITAMGQ
jgi:predicted  nucleic acid-binding Zn-ribbon protein